MFYTVNLEEKYLMLIEILFDIYTLYVFFSMQLYPLATLLSIWYQIKLTRSHWRSCFPFFITTVLFCIFYFFGTTNDSLSIWTHHRTKTVHELVWELKLILIRSPTWFRNFPNSIVEIARVPEYLIHCPGNPPTTGHLKW